jgi:hypothetical protein
MTTTDTNQETKKRINKRSESKIVINIDCLFNNLEITISDKSDLPNLSDQLTQALREALTNIGATIVSNQGNPV